jgi:2-methylcitrate dehydratase PrpD
VAFSLLTGYLGLDSFTAAAVNDPEIGRLRDRVEIVGDDSVGKRGARVTVTLADGHSLSHTVYANRGTPENPMSDSDLEAKLRSIAVPRIGVQASNALLARCWDLDATQHAGDVLRPFSHPD